MEDILSLYGSAMLLIVSPLLGPEWQAGDTREAMTYNALGVPSKSRTTLMTETADPES
jgi:hypothetical protein